MSCITRMKFIISILTVLLLSDNTACQTCDKGYYSRQQTCYKCAYRNCECSTHWGCDACLPGWYNPNGNCLNQCLPNCVTCSYLNSCTKCVDGRYGRVCEYSCPYNCKGGICNTDGTCSMCISGYWGNKCQYDCIGCFIAGCNENATCNYGCKQGFIADQISEGFTCNPCPTNCLTCSGNFECNSCNLGNWGLRCQGSCDNCQGECDKTNGCSSCKLGKYNLPSCDLTCNLNCRNTVCDVSTGACTNGCVDGFYGNRCRHECSTWCKTCTERSKCTGCRDGYFGTHCSDACMTRCKTCLASTSCSSCKPPFFNKHGSYGCECSTAKCASYRNGVCVSCHDTNWYPTYGYCCVCSTKCKNQACDSNGRCLECENTKHGDLCEHDCSNWCKNRLCHRNGSCIKCYSGYFGSKCQQHCSSETPHCKECSGEDSAHLICTICDAGFYPLGRRCSLCSGGCNAYLFPKCDSKTGACVGGCKSGWYGTRCDITCRVANCKQCNESDENSCQICNIGFYKDENSTCKTCPLNCLSSSECINGICGKGCNNGWSGLQCNTKCPDLCAACDQGNATICYDCLNGYFGDSCEYNCSSHCKPYNDGLVCIQSDGRCEYGCQSGYWNVTCSVPCSSGCIAGVCNESNGACINGCNSASYGVSCETICSEHCKVISDSLFERTCDEIYGTCLAGCDAGWYGELCLFNCSQSCRESACDRYNGTCTYGCKAGFTGFDCSQARQSDDQEAANLTAVGAGAGAGAVLLLGAGFVAIVLIVRKRRTSSKLDTNNRETSDEPANSRITDPGQVYSTINEPGTETKEIGNTGVSNLLYANVRMSDLSKDEETNTTYELARQVSDDYLKEEEIIDGELTEDLETDAREVDSTYYNVAGKTVTVVNLPEYIRNKSSKDIYADFQRIPKGLLKDYKEAKKAKNAHKNKYRFIYPYDESRVILHDGGSDYMNASFIEGYNNKKEYIASSGPFKKSYDTTPDFWRMIWQERCENIVMLTNPVENEETKCVKYWPEPGASGIFGKLQVGSVTEDRYSDFTIRTLTVTKGGESFSVRHLHFTAWPDKGVPHDVTSMIEFRQKVRSLHRDKNCPLLVHCSAGIGRTGTFIALDMLTFEGEDKGSVDIFGCVAALRSQRCNMVQTKEQYDYLHHAVLHSLTFDCRSIAGDIFLQNYNKLIERNGGKRIIDIQFQHLQSTTDKMTDEDKSDVLRNQSLSHKNRESADIPVDEYRVKLRENRKPGAVDYINAVWINGFRTRHKFIVAQTPLPSTVVDFLTLVHQEKCSCIVMMEEADISNKSVGVYWPADNQSIKHGVFKISCKDSTSTRHYAKKTLSITCHNSKGEDIHDVHLFIFTNWPKGNAVPKTSDSVLQLVKAVDTVNRSKDKESTILVHCMTGSERSCVYCAVSVLIEKMEIEHEVSVVNTLGQIKARRRSAFSSLDQYKFCHQAVISYLQSFDTYSNFGLRDSEASSV